MIVVIFYSVICSSFSEESPVEDADEEKPSSKV